MTKASKTKIGHRHFRAGDRVVQSRSLQFFSPVCKGFPWEVIKDTIGEVVTVRYVGFHGDKDEGTAQMDTKYLVKWDW